MDSVKIKTTISGHILTVALNSAAAKDFASLFPMTLTLDGYVQTEKVSNLNRQLSTDGPTSVWNPDVGDITYYVPRGNLVIFYKGFGYASGLVMLGKVEGDISFLNNAQKLTATFKLIK